MLPIVFQALPKWDSKYNSTSLTISKMLSEGRKVFYVEHPFSIVDRFRSGNIDQILKRKGARFDVPFEGHENFIVIHPPSTLPINALPYGNVYRILKRLYIRQLWKRIDHFLKLFGVKEFGYINSFDPVYFDFKSKYKCVFKIYHTVDLMEGEPYIAKHGVKAEFEAAKKADAVVTTSIPLAERLRNYNDNTLCIANAADFEHFSTQRTIPEEYRDRTKKRIVYTGNIGLRIDYKLIESIALSLPDTEIVLVGPKDPNYFAGGSLEKLLNVHFLGPKSFDALPAYIQHADVLLIPFLKNKLTHHIYPLKLNEYLASGKPILTTRFTDLQGFEDVLSISDDILEGIQHINKLLVEDNEVSRARRIQRAAENTWQHRMFEWEKLISKLSSKKFIDRIGGLSM